MVLNIYENQKLNIKNQNYNVKNAKSYIQPASAILELKTLQRCFVVKTLARSVVSKVSIIFDTC